MDYILDIIKSVGSVMFLQKLLISFSSRQLTWFTQPVDCLEMSSSPNLSHLLLVLAGLPGACPQAAIVEGNDEKNGLFDSIGNHSDGDPADTAKGSCSYPSFQSRNRVYIRQQTECA